MGDVIGLRLSSMAVCFDFHSTNVMELSNQNSHFYQFQCHHPLITQLRKKVRRVIKDKSLWTLFCCHDSTLSFAIQKQKQHNILAYPAFILVMIYGYCLLRMLENISIQRLLTKMTTAYNRTVNLFLRLTFGLLNKWIQFCISNYEFLAEHCAWKLKNYSF